MNQIPIDFTPGLTVRFPRWEDTFVTSVYSCRKGLNGVAAECDQSPSELSKRLSQQSAEPRPLRSQDIVGIIEATGDFTPIYWLIERFLQDPAARKEAALSAIANMAPVFAGLCEQAGIRKGKR